MDLRTIEHFLKLAKTLNFRKTAEEIYIAQPALSRQIMALEEELGVVLFDRNKRNVTLTEAGVYFREECERILEDFERVKQRTLQIYSGEGGEIKIAHSSSSMQFLLPSILAKIQSKMPLMKTILNESTNSLPFNIMSFNTEYRHERDHPFPTNVGITHVDPHRQSLGGRLVWSLGLPG